MAAKPDYPFAKLTNGETLEVAPGIHWVRMPLPFSLDHINLWFLEDGDGWTVVDCGYNDDRTRDYWRAVIAGIGGGRPIGRVVVTHFHSDHLGLAGWFAAEYGAGLWITYTEWLQAQLAWTKSVTHDVDGWIEFFVDNGLDDDTAAQIKAGRMNFGRAIYPVPNSLTRIWDDGAIDIGGREWRVITGAGHSPEHAALYCAELEVLISGDQVLPRITTNVSLWYTEPDGDPLRQYIDSLAKYRHLPADTLVLPSHNYPFRGLHDRLDYLVEHHRERLAVARDHCDTPRTAAELIPILFERQLDAMQMGFAIGESLAHLNFLVTAGEVRKFRDAGGAEKILYQRIA